MILLVTDAGVGGSVGFSSLAYPDWESRISNARQSCFVPGFVFMRMNKVLLR